MDKVETSQSVHLENCQRDAMGEIREFLNFLVTHPEWQEIFIMSREAFERWVGVPKMGMSFEEGRCAVRFKDISDLHCEDLDGDGVWEKVEGGHYDQTMTTPEHLQGQCNRAFRQSMKAYSSSYLQAAD